MSLEHLTELEKAKFFIEHDIRLLEIQLKNCQFSSVGDSGRKERILQSIAYHQDKLAKLNRREIYDEAKDFRDWLRLD